MFFHWPSSRSLSVRDDTVMPAICFATCNSLYLEAQRVGKSAALCAVDSTFKQYRKQCDACIAANGDLKKITQESYFNPKLLEIAKFCDTPGNVTSSGMATAQSTNSAAEQSFRSAISVELQIALKSQESVIASQASELNAVSLSRLVAGLTSLDAGIASQATPTTNPLSTSPTTAPSPTNTLTPTPQSKAWIAGAVVGPILLLILIALGIFFYRKKKLAASELEAPGEEEQKAQLHADSIPAPKYELEDHKNHLLLSELPANEVVGNELEGRGERDGGESVVK